MYKSVLMVLCLSMLLFSALNIPVTVKEPSGYSAVRYPVTAMVPLPRGMYHDVSSFRFTDASGNTIPAQFNPILRYVFQDSSIRFVQIVFFADISAKGSSQYYLKDDGGAISPSSAVTVDDNGSIITVNTGALKFTVCKNGFNLFNKVWLMPGDTLVSDSTGGQGAFFNTDRGLQNFKDRVIDSFAIEESGPVRVVLRFESYTRSVDSTTNRPGFIFRIYAYAGSRNVKVDAGLINGERSTWGYPIYFKDFSMRTPLSVVSPSVKFGISSTVREREAGSGCRLVQWNARGWRLQDGSGVSVDSGTEQLPGWFSVNDGTKGLMVTQRFFWQTVPNAFSVDANSVISVTPFPDTTTYYDTRWNWGMFKDTLTGYHLDDMRGIRKEYLYHFHGAETDNAKLLGLSRNFQWPPVASVPLAWHRQCKTTLDFGGIIPDTVATIPAVTDTPTWLPDNFDETKDGFSFTWNHYKSDRRYVCDVGSWPRSTAGFLVDGSPGRYFQSEMWAMGEMNLRTYWCPGWKEIMNPTSAMGKVNYCSGEWRSTAFEYNMRKGGAYRPGTRALNWGARDFEHLWVYNIEEFYNFSGDPWIRDCMLFWCEYFTSVQKNVMNDSSIGNMATRGSGHTLSAFLSAMRVTNGAQYLPIADKWVNTIFTRASRTYPKYSVPDGEGPFQLQFLDRAIASYMQMVEGTHPLRWQKGFQVLWGHAEWNTYYANYCYYWRDTGIVSYLLDTIPGGSGGSFAEAMAFISLEAQWRPFVRNLRTVYPSSQMYFNRSVWDGDWMGRPTITWGKRFYNKPNSDTVPPAKINDLSGTGFYGGVKLGFTLPEGARKYHVVWGYKPIKEGPDTLNYRDTLKYFQAYPGGVFEASRIAGAAESVTVDLPVGDTVFYFAVKTLDTINNISPMSNLFRIRHNVVSSEASGSWFAGKQYIMAQPNPFNPVVNIIIKGVSVNKIRRLCVYGVSGKLVADFGRSSSLSWNASGSPSGLYIIRLDTDSRSMTRRIVLAR